MCPAPPVTVMFTLRQYADEVSARASTVSWRDAVVLGSIALIWCLAFSWVPSVWYDEAATVLASTRTWADLVRMLGTVDLVHGVYYGFMHVWFTLVGYTPFTLRFPSAVFAALAVVGTVRLVGSLASRRVAILSAVVLIVLPRFTLAAVEGRSYSLTMLLGVLMTIAFVRAIRSAGKRWGLRAWDIYALLAILASLVFLYLALLVVAHLVALLWLRARGRLSPGILGGFLWRAIPSAVLLLPFVLAAAGQASQLAWVASRDGGTFAALLVAEFFPSNVPLAILGWALAVAGAVLLLRRPAGAMGAALAISTIAVPVLVLVLVSVTVLPTFVPRYVTFATPAMAVLIAVAIDAIPVRIVRFASLALVVALALPSWIVQRTPLGKGSDAAAVAAYVETVDARHPSESVGIVWGDLARFPDGTARIVQYGYPTPFAQMSDLTLATSAAEAGTLWETTRPLTIDDLDGIDAVWVIGSSRDARPDDLRLLALGGFTAADQKSFYELEAVRFAR